jgi:hypothetical protein
MVLLSGWWYTYPSEKYESQIGSSSHILWENRESHKFMLTNQLLFYLPFFPLDLKNFRPGPAG